MPTVELGLIVRQEKHPGENFCLAFHPDQYIRTKMINGLSIMVMLNLRNK